MKRSWLAAGKHRPGRDRKSEDRRATRDQIINLADSMIRTKGFNAFSYGDIAAILEVRNAAIHYYFPTKSELGQAVIKKELDRIREYQLRNKDGPGDEQLRFLVSVFYRNAQIDNICLMGSLLPDFATFEPEMQSAVNQMCDTILEWMTGSLDKARAEGRVRFEGEAADRAALTVSTLLVALLLVRARGENIFFQMADRLLADLGVDWRVRDMPKVEWPFPDSPSFT